MINEFFIPARITDFSDICGRVYLDFSKKTNVSIYSNKDNEVFPLMSVDLIFDKINKIFMVNKYSKILIIRGNNTCQYKNAILYLFNLINNSCLDSVLSKIILEYYPVSINPIDINSQDQVTSIIKNNKQFIEEINHQFYETGIMDIKIDIHVCYYSSDFRNPNKSVSDIDFFIYSDIMESYSDLNPNIEFSLNVYVDNVEDVKTLWLLDTFFRKNPNKFIIHDGCNLALHDRVEEFVEHSMREWFLTI